MVPCGDTVDEEVAAVGGHLQNSCSLVTQAATAPVEPPEAAVGTLGS